MAEKHRLSNSPKRILIKIGSAVLTKRPAGLDEKMINSIARSVSKIIDEGRQVLIVSSGAVSAGMGELGVTKKPTSVRDKQTLAAVGQSKLMQAYGNAFGRFRKTVAQILLTRQDMEDRQRYLNTRTTILSLLHKGIIPIINENDTTTVDELTFTDNDLLSSIIATKVGVDLFIMLTNVKGVFSADPQLFKDAEFLRTITEITPEIVETCKQGRSFAGRGGMQSKIISANVAKYAGITTIIANGMDSNILKDIFWGEFEGTIFVPDKERRISGKKRWIAFVKSGKSNTIVVDDGAKTALVDKGKSLLPVGIKECGGDFLQGDVVTILDTDARVIGKGLANYNVHEVEKIKGVKSSDILERLGYKYYDEVIHRDNMIIFDEDADILVR